MPTGFPSWRLGESFALAVRQRAFWVRRPGVHWSVQFHLHFEIVGHQDGLYQVVVTAPRGGRSESDWVELHVRERDLLPVRGWRHRAGLRIPMGADLLTDLMSQHPPELAAAREHEEEVVLVAQRPIRAAAYRTPFGRQLWPTDPSSAPYFLRHEGRDFQARLVWASRFQN